MKAVTVYTVSLKGDVRFETLRQDEAIACAQSIYNSTKTREKPGDICDIFEIDRTPVDHTASK